MWELSALYKEKNGKNFFDLLVIAEDANYLNKSFESLIKIGYFSDFGSVGKLLKFYEEFTSGKNRYKNSSSEKSKEKRKLELMDFWDWMKEEDDNIYNNVMLESSVIGQPYLKRPNIHKNYIYIIDIDTKSYHPKIKVHILKTGEEKTIKVRQDLYHEHHFKVGDILLAKTFEKKFRKTRDENGNWIETDNFDWFMTTWYKMKPKDKFIEG